MFVLVDGADLTSGSLIGDGVSGVVFTYVEEGQEGCSGEEE